MKAYRIYLTYSYETAAWIAEGISAAEKEDRWMRGRKVISISHGAIMSGDTRIPEIFKDGRFHCTVEYESDKPEYEIVFA